MQPLSDSGTSRAIPMANKLSVQRSGPSAPVKSAGAGGVPAVPRFQIRNLAVIAAVVAILWLTALISGSKVFIAIVAVLTALVVGLLGYVYYWARKQRAMMELLQTASVSPEARREVLAKLQAEKGADKDVMNAIARAQLEAQEDPEKALATLETIDLKKVPAPLVDDVRAFRAQMYLLLGRPQDARPLVDEIKLSAASTPESRAALTATVAETWARTGKHKEALDLLNTIKPEDPDYAQARVPLLFARIYASFAAGQRDNVRRDMNALMKQDINLLGRFVMPKARVHPELQKIARDVLARNPEVRKMVQKQFRGARRLR